MEYATHEVTIDHETHEKDHETHKKILYGDECYAIQGAVFEVYRELGSGFLEAVYQESLGKELQLRNIPFLSQVDLVISYKGENLTQRYRPDFVCYSSIIVKIEAIKETTVEHRAQLLKYLKATGLRVGLLVNFGHYPKATVESIVL